MWKLKRRYHSVRRVEDREFIAIALDPIQFDNTVHEFTNGNPIEIIPHWKTRDPLICGIPWAIKTELESGELNGTLYVDVLKNALSVHVLRHYCTKKPKLREFEAGLDPSTLHIVIDINNSINQDFYLA
jgi:AraC family transcriptional regulator